MSALDITMRNYLPVWIDNMLWWQSHEPPRDVLEAALPAGKERIVIAGNGPSIDRYLPLTSDLIVGNQTTLLAGKVTPDIVLVSDCHPDVKKKLEDGARNRGPDTILFMASICDPSIKTMELYPFSAVYMFHHPIAPKQSPILDLIFSKLNPPHIVTNVAQCGCATNAALMLMAYFVINSKLPKIPIHLAGVDYANEDGSQPENFRDYAKDNETIIKSLAPYAIEFTMERTPGPLHNWIQEV